MHEQTMSETEVVHTAELSAAVAPAEVSTRRLVSTYSQVFIAYLLVMFVLWAVGIEGVYGSPMPFYALVFPVFTEAMAWHLAPLGVLAVALAGLAIFWKRVDWDSGGPSARATAWFVFAVVVFSFVFAGAVAMLRGGIDGISHAYQRQAYEYISDIGRTSGIRALFHDYAKVRPYLSMHAKVHPPGPIAVLWLMSYVVGQGPLALSLATMALGALGIVPLYLWSASVAGKRAGLTCCMLYSVMPTVVMFIATSADILFMPFTLWTLYLFWRALDTKPLAYGLAAGVAYGLCSLLSFSLLGLGAFFAFAGLWRMTHGRTPTVTAPCLGRPPAVVGGVPLLDWLRNLLRKKRGHPPQLPGGVPDGRVEVILTAAAMIAGFLALHGAVRWWSGFDMIACFRDCKAQFDIDQAHLDDLTPRYPGWTWRLANPAAWFYFAGIPASVMALWRFARPEKQTRGLFLVFALTLVALTSLYLGRGEGERSAMYIMPFIAVPAAHLLDKLSGEGRRLAPIAATLGFMAFQCWFTESVFYTFW